MAPKSDAFDDSLNPVFRLQKPITAPSLAPYFTPRKFHYESDAWFDIRVFYVRVSSCSLEYAPDTLNMRYSPTCSHASVEVNGGRVSPILHPSLILKRDRMDTDLSEVIYVNTDNLRTSNDLSFNIFDKDDLLICGCLKRSDSKDGKVDEEANGQRSWKMECTCVMGSPKCSFTRKRPNFSALTCPPPCVEVYLAGRVSDLPVVLTESVKLIARRKYLRPEVMDTIKEDESELCIETSVADNLTQESQKREELLCKRDSYRGILDWEGIGEIEEQDIISSEQFSLTGSDEYPYLEGEEGELSWFKAGVRVGVGIGLGICLGLGIGVGVLVQAYQSTTKTLTRGAMRRKLL